MQITIQYFAQVRAAAGTESEPMSLPDGASVETAILAAVQQHPDLAGLAMTPQGAVRPSLLVLVNDQPPADGLATVLRDDDLLAIFSPVSGG
jgi:molybdopterin converting factor small subunit